MKSRAAIFIEPGKPLVIDEIEIGDLGPTDTLIKLYASGVCHSDLHWLRGYRGSPGPTLLGHEATGEVVAVGSAVTDLQAGDRVVTSVRPRDGSVEQPGAAGSQASITWQGQELGGHRDGIYTWGEHAVVNAEHVVKVPDDTPREAAAPLGCGIVTGAGTVMNALNVQPGETCAVFGVGGVGLSAVGALKVRQASRIIAVDLDDRKLEFAKQFGATDTVNAGNGDPVQQIHELTGGGTDYAIDAIGARGTTEQIVNAVRGRRGAQRGGVAAMLATGNMVRVPTGMMVMNEKSLIGVIIGSSVPQRDYLEILRWHREGLFDLEALVTERHSLDEINEATERLEQGQVFGRSVITF